MKYVIVVLAIVVFSFINTAEAQLFLGDRATLLIKFSPTMPLMEKFGGGIECMISENRSIEIEGLITNLNPEANRTFFRDEPEDNNNYHSLAMRYKFYYREDKMDTKTPLFSGIYVAPGLRLGTRRKNYHQLVDNAYFAASADIGAMASLHKSMTIEAFIGIEINDSIDRDISDDSSRILRCGFRVGATL